LVQVKEDITLVRALIDAAAPKMEKALEHLKEELGSLRTGRASTLLVENIQVEVYGMTQPLKAVASIGTPDARTIAITPWDKNAMGPIEKAIRDTPSLGLSPSNDGHVIRLSIPALTEERRKDLVKTAGTKVEECRIALRNVRHDVLKEVQRLLKDKTIQRDDEVFAEQELNKKIDQFQKRIEELEAAKAKEIMEV
jgi:ribosome recycling factor